MNYKFYDVVVVENERVFLRCEITFMNEAVCYNI